MAACIAFTEPTKCQQVRAIEKFRTDPNDVLQVVPFLLYILMRYLMGYKNMKIKLNKKSS